MTPIPCIFLMGPTASGKTDLAVFLVQHLPVDIISVDSAMVYRQMDIGSAKPTPDILAKAPHRLIDIRDPSEPYSAAQFCQDALAEIQNIQANGRIPLLVGGTGLYFRSLQQGLSDLPSANSDVRKKLDAEAAVIGWSGMHQKLAHIDPQTAGRIHFNDTQRIQRALEVYEITGLSLTEHYQRSAIQSWSHPTVKIIVAPQQREVLHARIAQRFQDMLDIGLVDEVRTLFERGDLDPTLPAIRAVGYRQVWHYLAGKFDEKTLTEQGIIATRQLAKRQLTWLRAEKNAVWFDSQLPTIAQQVLHYLMTCPILLRYFSENL